jgi:hypothetical protein
LISRFGCTLIIILVALTTNTAHTDATHAWDGDAAVGAGLDDTSLLTNLELW